MELRQILLISLLFLPSYQGKVCGYEVSWKSRSERVPYLQTVPCQTADCPEESLEIFRSVLSSPHLIVAVRFSEGDPLDDQGDPAQGGGGEMLRGLEVREPSSGRQW